MQDRINIYNARTHFSQIIERVEGGETITIARNNVPVAELRPVRLDPIRAAEGCRSLRERIRAFNKGASVLKPGENWRDLIHEKHSY